MQQKKNIISIINSTANSCAAHTITTFMKHISMLALLLKTFALGARAEDYVITYTNDGTTYYLARKDQSSLQSVTIFDPTTCIWSCASNPNSMTAGTLNNSNTYGYLFQTVDGTRYFLSADGDALALVTSASSSNYTRWRTDGTYVYNRYSSSRSYYIGLSNNGVARQTNTTNASRPYPVTFTPVSTTFTNPSINGNTVLTAIGDYTYTSAGATYQTGGYTNYIFYGTNHYLLDNNNTAITPKAATLSETTWSLTANDYATINSSGAVTVGI